MATKISDVKLIYQTMATFTLNQEMRGKMTMLLKEWKWSSPVPIPLSRTLSIVLYHVFVVPFGIHPFSHWRLELHLLVALDLAYLDNGKGGQISNDIKWSSDWNLWSHGTKWN